MVGDEARLEDLMGPLECAVLGALWSGSPASVAEVRSRVNEAQGSDLAYTTVMTVLGRMFDKDILERQRDGRQYLYSPRYAEDELVGVLSRREVDRLVERYGDAALAAFAERLEDADPALLDRVRRLAAGS